MNTLEIIKKRRSVRTFDTNSVSKEELKNLLDFAEKVENPYGLPITWKILNAKENGLTSPVIVGTDTYIAGKTERVPNAEQAFGYSFEKIVLYLQERGIGTTWIAGTMNRSAFEKAVELDKNEVMPCVSPLGYPSKKMSLRETMMRKGVKADFRYGFGELFFDGDFQTPLTEEKADKLKDAFEAVRLAPSAVNKQPWRIILEGNHVHFYEKHNKGFVSGNWDIQKIDIGIALCHFETVAKENGISLAFEQSNPNISTEENVQYIASYVIK